MRTADRATLRKEVQIEAGLSTMTGHDTQNAERINHYLNRAQRDLEVAYTWPLESTFIDITVAAEEQYVTFDTSMPFELIDRVSTLYGDTWLLVEYGITDTDRSIYKPNQRATPIRKWEVNKAVANQFEIWPISGKVETVRTHGQVALQDMEDDSDVCTLDADAIVLQAAGLILAKTNQDLAALALKGAENRTEYILNRNVGRKVSDGYMGRRHMRVWRPGLDYIPPEN